MRSERSLKRAPVPRPRPRVVSFTAAESEAMLYLLDHCLSAPTHKASAKMVGSTDAVRALRRAEKKMLKEEERTESEARDGK